MLLSPEIYETLDHYLNDVHAQMSALILKKDPTDVELLLSTMICLQEECWELAAEIRKFTELSFNKKKVDNFKKENLLEEIADIYIILFTLCKQLGITSLDQAMLQKIQKNNKRGY